MNAAEQFVQLRTVMSRNHLVLVVLLVGACGADAPVAVPRSSPEDASPAPTRPAPRFEAPVLDPSPTLASLCALPRNEVHFRPRSRELTTQAKELLGQVARCIVDGPGRGMKLLVVGHAYDEKRSTMRLARARTKAISSELHRQGISRGDLRTAAIRDDRKPLRTLDGNREHGVTLLLDPKGVAAAPEQVLPGRRADVLGVLPDHDGQPGRPFHSGAADKIPRRRSSI